MYISCFVFGALVISDTIEYLAFRPVLEDTRFRSINSAVDNLASLIAEGLWDYNLATAEESAVALLEGEFISGIIVHTHDGEFVYRGGDLANTDYLNPQIEAREESIDRNAFVIKMPLIISLSGVDDKVFNIGTMEIRSDNRLISEQLNNLGIITLTATVILILTLQAIFYFVVRHTIAKPLEAVTWHVQKFAANLDEGVIAESTELAKRRDEIGRLYQIFNHQRQALIERDNELNRYREQLEETILERTSELRETNESLQDSLKQLKLAQDELIQSEKMASLGALVSGIAHEVNTPLGVAITASSHLGQELKNTRSMIDENKLTKTKFDDFLGECDNAEKLLTNNLGRAVQLINSFKQIAVDKSHNEYREVNVGDYLKEIIFSLQPTLKKTSIQVLVTAEESDKVRLPVGAIAQIFTNLIMNSYIHGYDSGKHAGTIAINVTRENDKQLRIIYQDDGKGMDEHTLKHIYDPFFTTRRSSGGSGLGMNIVYNLVTSKLKGQLDTQSKLGEGLKVNMVIEALSPDYLDSQETL